MAMLKIRQTVQLHNTQQAFHKSDALLRGFVGGRGAGKSWVGAYDLLRRAKPKRLYLVGAPTYPMLRDASWRSLQDLAVQMRFLKKLNSSEPSMKLGNGAEIIGRSADNPERFRGPNLSGLWLDEASQAEKEAFEIGLACLRQEGEQGWFSATFTPRGKQHWTYEVFGQTDAEGKPLRPNAALFKTRTKDNPFLPAEFYETVKQQYSSALTAQELEGEFTDLEGAMFRCHWFPIDDQAPESEQTVRYWDLASTEKKKPGDDPDWTVGVLMQRSKEGVYHILDVRRGRATPAGVEALVRQTAEMDGKSVKIFMEQEPGSSGVNTIDHYQRNVLAGWTFRGERPTGEKSERARPLSAMAESQNVHLVRGAWNKDFLDEIEVFPLGKHDDQVDAAVGAFDKLTLHKLVNLTADMFFV
ncbi:MAG: phage terminase large subunit [Gemmataceae bacterium]